MTATERIYNLQSGVQHYAWGSRAHGDSMPYIAALLGQAPGLVPWAELWVGAHPKLCSQVVLEDGGSLPLCDFIAEEPERMLGKSVMDGGFRDLPFLLKVLSCEQSLSIQLHPDKETAERLFRRKSSSCNDGNHKPEIMIALTPFHAMVGFRKLEDILQDIRREASLEPWLRICSLAPRLGLRTLCETLLNFPANGIRQILVRLQKELVGRSGLTESERLYLELLEQHPCDRAALFAFLLNRVCLSPGEYVYIPPNEPHAYLSGTGVECMTNCDNVIRAGLTPKDIDKYAMMMTISYEQRTEFALQPTSPWKGCRVYGSPAREFEVRFHDDCASSLSDGEVPRVLLVLSGAAELAWRGGSCCAVSGTSWFCPAFVKEMRLRPLAAGTCVVEARFPVGKE